jgi:hypothetical protein
VALAIRMRSITSGSTKAAMRLSSSLCSSNKAKTYLKKKNISIAHMKEVVSRHTNEIQAAASKILTRRSSNCSKMSFQSGLPSSVGNSGRKKNKLIV